MNKYELTVVVSAKLDDEGRTAEVEKVKALIEKFGGTITKIEEAGKKNLRNPEDVRSILLLHRY